MSSQSSSMYDTSFWKIALKPFRLLLTLLLVIAGLEILIITSHLTYLKYWNNSFDAVMFMRDSVSEAWNATLTNDVTTPTSQLAVWISDFFYWLFFKTTWIHQMMQQFATDAPTNTFDQVLRNHFVYPLRQEINVAMLATQLLGMRLALLLSAIPMFMLAYALGFSDGLVERYIRKASAGRESSSLYHRAKYFQLSGLIFLCFVYIVAPLSVDPRWVLLPSALLLGFMCRLQWKYYKKYL